MASSANTLEHFIADLMHKQNHNNSSLAAGAGVSESVIRNLLKHGIDSRAKDPDPRTLRQVADTLEIDAIMLFRLAGYIPPQSSANSVRAEYLADVFDELPPEKQDTVLGILEAMAGKLSHKDAIHSMRTDPQNPIAGLDLSAPNLARLMANQLIAQNQMTEPAQAHSIEKFFSTSGKTFLRQHSTASERLSDISSHLIMTPQWLTQNGGSSIN